MNLTNILLIVAIAALLISGCYTQLGTVKSEADYEYEENDTYYEAERPEDDQEYATEEEYDADVSESNRYYDYDHDYYPSANYRMYFRYYYPSAYYRTAYFDPFFYSYGDCYWYYDPWFCGTSLIYYPWPGFYPWYYRHHSYFAFRFSYYDPGYYYSPGFGYSRVYYGSGARKRTNRDFGSTRGEGRYRDGSRRGSYTGSDSYNPPPVVRSRTPSGQTERNRRVGSDQRSRKRVRQQERTDGGKDSNVRGSKRTRDTNRKKTIRRYEGSTRGKYTRPASRSNDSKRLTGNKRQVDSRKRGEYRRATQGKDKRSKSSSSISRHKGSSKKFSRSPKRNSSGGRSSYSRPSRSSRPSVAPSKSRGTRSSATRGSRSGSSGGSKRSGGGRGR